ncbi:MAG: hypothetical protein LIP09_14125 [Bacteroidales bacterium]|nr:hypothetical protein [Bacteroidales bacterium]MCC8119866.1 hypothetical protein [Bacteroidales bacterium]
MEKTAKALELSPIQTYIVLEGYKQVTKLNGGLNDVPAIFKFENCFALVGWDAYQACTACGIVPEWESDKELLIMVQPIAELEKVKSALDKENRGWNQIDVVWQPNCESQLN